MTRGDSSRQVDSQWDTLLRLIPGYDPFAGTDDFFFDPDAAQRALDFFPECLTHIEGMLAGQPFILEPWQQAIIANLFGWKKKADRYRRYREAFIFVPRKNGKTPLAAGIGNYVLFCDGERGGQNYCAASEREQAALVYRHAKGMIENEPELSSRAKIYKGFGHRSIEHLESGSFFRVISADADTKHGGNSHLVIIDELHAQPNRDLVDVLQTSLASANRPQPLMIHITTSDFAGESICNEKYDYAIKVRDGIIGDTSFLPVVYEAANDADWTDEKIWEGANPNIDVSVSREYLRRECMRAQESPAYENTFKRLHLNIRTEQDVRWLPMDKWDACNEPVNPDALRGSACYAGLDLASTRDVTALVLYFPGDAPPTECKAAVLPYFWVPSEGARQRERRDRVPYETWARDGFIELTPGNVVDYDMIRQRINEIGELFNIREIAIDKWNSTQLQIQLIGDGFEVVPFGQGFASMSAPSKELERQVISGAFAHGGNPVLRWMASNVSVQMDAAGNVKPAKDKSSDKIDGIVSLVMAIGQMLVAEEKKPSVYSTRGVMAI